MIAQSIFREGIPRLGAMLRQGRTTSVELTELALSLLEGEGRALNAVAHLRRGAALAEARLADADLKAGRDHGPLHGIPYGAKDLLAVANEPTEWGSFAHKGQLFSEDATVVTRLRAAGAVLVAKMSMVSLAGGGGYRFASASISGPGRNPWDRERWAGGSSSGSGAAVGGGLLPFAIGSETWGSIVVPASFCGATGLRPTYGRVPRTGAMALSWTMDKIGPLARTAEDASLVLAAIAGPDGKDASASVGKYRHAARPRRNLRVGVLREDFDSSGDKLIGAAYDRALKDLESAGCRLEDASLPDAPYGAVAGMLITIEGRASFENIITGPKLALLNDPEQRTGLVAGMCLTGVDYLRAMRLRTGCRRAVAETFRRFDALVAPSLMDVATPVDANLDTAFTGNGGLLQAAGNCTGIPCLSVPMGYGAHGLPCGLQICAAAGDDATAVAVARAYQRVTRWHRDAPGAMG